MAEKQGQLRDVTGISLLTSIDVSLVLAGIWILARATFYDAFFSALGVPTDLDLTPSVSVTWLLIVIAGLVFTLNQFGIYFRNMSRFQSGLANAMFDTFVVLVVGSAVRQWIVNYLGHPSKVVDAVFYGIVVVALFIDWILPVFRHRAIPGYRQKLTAFHTPSRSGAKLDAASSEAGPASNSSSKTLIDWVLARGGPTLRLACTGAVIAFAGGHYFGHQAAMDKREWIEVSHPELPVSDRHWVLLSRSGLSVFAIELSSDGTVGPAIRTVSLEKPGCTLRPLRLSSPPKEWEQPAAKPQATPPAPTLKASAVVPTASKRPSEAVMTPSP